jgi:hypothetical protein
MGLDMEGGGRDAAWNFSVGAEEITWNPQSE